MGWGYHNGYMGDALQCKLVAFVTPVVDATTTAYSETLL